MIVAACQDAEILRWTALPVPFTPAAADIEEARVRWAEGAVAELAIVRDGAVLAAIHLAFHDDRRASVAYRLARDARGKASRPAC